MALIKLGGLAQDVRGTLNGSVFSRNRGGAYIRTKVSPVQPVSEFSSRSREFFGAIAQRWSTVLTDVQRAGWVAFAAVHPFINVFGDAIILNGLAFYQSVNRRLAQMGEDFIDDAPATFDVEDLGLTELNMITVAGVVTSAQATVGRLLTADELLYIWTTQPLLGARQPQKNDFRLINPPTAGKYDPLEEFASDWNARFVDTTVTPTSRLFYRLQAVNFVTGAASSPVVGTINIA